MAVLNGCVNTRFVVQVEITSFTYVVWDGAGKRVSLQRCTHFEYDCSPFENGRSGASRVGQTDIARSLQFGKTRI